MSERDPITLEEATQPGPESTEPEYLAWKERKIRAAVKQADDAPDNTYYPRADFWRDQAKILPLKLIYSTNN